MGRVLLAAAAVVLVAAAFVVPLPLSVAQPSVLAPADAVASVTVSEEFLEAAAQRLEPVSGTYYFVPRRSGPALVEILAASASQGRDVMAPVDVPSEELARPDVIGAVTGLGLSPARLDGSPLPVTLDVDVAEDPGSLGIALHLFDTTSALDVAAGRRILGIGRMGADQSLSCPIPPDATLAAARDVDVVVLPAACAVADATSSTDALVLVAGTFAEAVDALVTSQQP